MMTREKLLALATVCLPILLASPCLAAEDAHGSAAGSVNPLMGNPDLAVVTAVIFLVLLAVLWKFAWGPIMEGLRKREESIAEEIAAAQRSHQEARKLLQQHEARMAAAADEVRVLLEQGRKEADGQRQQIIADAQQAARAEKERAVREIGVAKNDALGELAESSVEMAVDLAGRIVGRQLEPADHTRLIQEALEEFPSRN